MSELQDTQLVSRELIVMGENCTYLVSEVMSRMNSFYSFTKMIKDANNILHEDMRIQPIHATDLFLCLISKGKNI